MFFLYIENEYVMKNILQMTEEDVKQIKAQIAEDLAADPMAYPTLLMMVGGLQEGGETSSSPAPKKKVASDDDKPKMKLHTHQGRL